MKNEIEVSKREEKNDYSTKVINSVFFSHTISYHKERAFMKMNVEQNVAGGNYMVCACCNSFRDLYAYINILLRKRAKKQKL